MLRIALITAIAALSVMPATTAIAHSTKKLHVHNNTTYDFTGGYIENDNNATVTNFPSSIPKGESREIDIKKKSGGDMHVDLHWSLSGDISQEVAVKYKLKDQQQLECHTDVPEGIHSDVYNCSSNDIKYYFCDSSSKSDCDK